MWKYVTTAIAIPLAFAAGVIVFDDDSNTDTSPTTTTSMVIDSLLEETTTTLNFPPTTPDTNPDNTGYVPISVVHSLDMFDDPIYADCIIAHMNGYGPYFRDVDNEYWFYLDSNGDGIVCE